MYILPPYVRSIYIFVASFAVFASPYFDVLDASVCLCLRMFHIIEPVMPVTTVAHLNSFTTFKVLVYGHDGFFLLTTIWITSLLDTALVNELVHALTVLA